MITQAEIRTRSTQVQFLPDAERERIYNKYFTAPSARVRFLCEHYGFDRKRILDVACHYGYHLIHFGQESIGVDANRHFLQFATEMGLNVQYSNIELGLPDFAEPFDGLFFSGTLEEIYSPHVLLMRFRKYLKPEGVLCLVVPVVPPRWIEALLGTRMRGYGARAHLYFFTPRTLSLVVRRAGYEILQMVSPGIYMNPMLRPVHNVLLPLAPTVTIMARPIPNFKYSDARVTEFVPEWAQDLAPYHLDYEEKAEG